MMFDTIIRNGKAVLPDGTLERKDICIDGGRIAEIRPGQSGGLAREIVDAGGLLVFPGMIDVHAHLNDPGYEWRETFDHGTAAAAAGGVSTVIDMPLQNKPAMSSAALLRRKQKLVGDKAYVDYAFWGAALGDNQEEVMGLCAEGIVGLKAFFSPVGADYRTSSMMEAVRTAEALHGSRVRFGFHCEDYAALSCLEDYIKKHKKYWDWRDYLDAHPVASEVLSVKNAVELGEWCRVPIHICHVSHPAAAEIVRQAQRRGVDVTAETCPHYLLLTEEDLIERGSLLKCAPPLRDKEAVEGLWEYVLDGTISCVASDHSPSALGEKQISGEDTVFSVWGGISGIQSGFQIMYELLVNQKKQSPSILAGLLSAGPAKAFGLERRKGRIAVGQDADLALLDPTLSWEIRKEDLHYLNPFSAFVGQKGKGVPVCTFVRGKRIALDGKVDPQNKGWGQYIKAYD